MLDPKTWSTRLRVVDHFWIGSRLGCSSHRRVPTRRRTGDFVCDRSRQIRLMWRLKLCLAFTMRYPSCVYRWLSMQNKKKERLHYNHAVVMCSWKGTDIYSYSWTKLRPNTPNVRSYETVICPYPSRARKTNCHYGFGREFCSTYLKRHNVQYHSPHTKLPLCEIILQSHSLTSTHT